MSPSNMTDDVAYIGCVFALETAMDEMKSQNEATHHLLQSVLDRLSPSQAQNAPDRIRPPSANSIRFSPIPASSAGQKKNFLKPSAPLEFDGSRSAGKAFLMLCQTYIHLCPESFEDNDIVWAISYMKTGCAGYWATHEFEHEVKSGHLCFIDWPDFEDEFRRDFMPLDSKAAAVNTLETTSYFQGKQMVDDYLDQFRDLIEDSGYTDPKTIVVKLRRGLDRQILTALAGMAMGRPSDTKLEAWFHLTVQMDQNCAADKAFHTSYRQMHPPTSATHLLMPLRSVPTASPAHFTHSNPSPSNPIPMDIDAVWKNKTAPDTCCCCGKTRHWSKDCNLHFNICYMNEDELEMELENRLAAKDIAVLKVSSDVEPLVSIEDFVSLSG